jgi:hypothetical protein
VTRAFARLGLCSVLLSVLLAGCGAGGDGGEGRGGNSGQRSQAPTELETSTPAASAPTPSAQAAPSRTWWVPAPGTTWQLQFTTPVDTGVDVAVYDIDGTENGADVVRALHGKGRKVVCYVNAGADEDFRPDHGAFPERVLGKPNGWKGEKWLDIRQLDVLRPIMAARFDTCRTKGFDGVEADLVDGYASDTGFPITARDQLAYNHMLAELAHQRGMAIGLKNDLDQVSTLVDVFDFSVNEQCAEYSECDKLTPFIRAGKAVFHVEYKLDNAAFCAQTTRLHLSSMRKNKNLDAPRWPC